VQRPENDSRPIMILVSGMPASGKSTLVEHLASELRLPFFTKDGLKVLLVDVDLVPVDELDEETSERLGAQAITALYHIAQRILEAGGSVLLEANFRAELTRSQIEPFHSQAIVRQVACKLPMYKIVERFEERQNGDERQSVIAEVDDIEQLAENLERKDNGPIVGVPTLLVDTSDGFDPTLRRSHVSAGRVNGPHRHEASHPNPGARTRVPRECAVMRHFDIRSRANLVNSAKRLPLGISPKPICPTRVKKGATLRSPLVEENHLR